MHRWDGPASFPYVITIFSAPNYCGYYENKASVLIIDKGNLSLKQYDESETPYRLPDNLDVFSWSMPFLAEKVVSMLFTIVKKGVEDEPIGEDGVDVNKILNNDANANTAHSKIINKILFLLLLYRSWEKEDKRINYAK